MPFKISGSLQSVNIHDTIYIGGVIGNCTVLAAYNFQSLAWHRLNPYMARDSAMVVISNQLALVGGVDQTDEVTNQIAVWNCTSKKWTHPYAAMLTARSHASVVVYKQWLFVAGGKSKDCKVSDVEVLDLDSQHWVSAPSAPEAWTSMKSAIVRDQWYLMGGFGSEGTATDKVYSVSLPTLLFHAGSTLPNCSSSSNIWNTVSTLKQTSSFPLCVADTLLAVGGISDNDIAKVSAIHYFMPESEEWGIAGQLPSPLNQCACTLTSDGHVTLASSQNLKFYVGNIK